MRSIDKLSSDLLDASEVGIGGPSFSLRNRVARAIFAAVWLLGARWTPPPLHSWRVILLRFFGARIGHDVRIYGSTRIWHPPHLVIGDRSLIGPHVNLYNQGKISIGSDVVISQGAHICASSHDVSDPNFQLVLRPVSIGNNAWVAAEAFVGPGVIVGDGAVLGARAAAFRDLDPWTIFSGNPAVALKPRAMRPRNGTCARVDVER